MLVMFVYIEMRVETRVSSTLAMDGYSWCKDLDAEFAYCLKPSFENNSHPRSGPFKLILRRPARGGQNNSGNDTRLYMF